MVSIDFFAYNESERKIGLKKADLFLRFEYQGF